MADNDPGQFIPLNKPRELGLGSETDGELDYLVKTDVRFPQIYKIRNKNFIIAADRDRYRAQLIADALRERGVGVRREQGAPGRRAERV